MAGKPDKKAVLEFLADSLSFAKTLEQFPNLTVETLRGVLLERAESGEQRAEDKSEETLGEGALEAFIDGASRGNPGQAAAGVFLKSKERTWEFSIPLGITTNNVAEYDTLIIALKEAKKLGANEVLVRSDSELLVKQVTGGYK